MAPFKGGMVNPELPQGCHDERYRVEQLPSGVLDAFRADDPEHVDLTVRDFETLFNTKAERVSLAMVGLTDVEVDMFAPLLDPTRTHGIEGHPDPHAGARYCRSLYLNHNKITAKGAEVLCAALEQNTTLTELYLQYNKIGDDGCKHIGRLLERNRRLVKLELGANQIGEPGIADVLDGLEDNGTLTSVGLFGNKQEINDDLAEAARRLQPEARMQRKIGIQVKLKFKELILKQLEADKTPPASLPRSWEGVLWEQISDELSSFFSNTDGAPGAPSAKALLAIPRLEPKETIALLNKAGGAEEKLTADKGPIAFTVLAGDLARTEGAKADVELAYTHPKTGKPAVGIVRDAEVKRRLCERPTSIVTYLNPVTMFPSKPRFRGAGFVDEAGAQYICCAGPKGAVAGRCPYRPRYRAPAGAKFDGEAYTYAIERDRDTGRFFLQGYGQCVRLEEQKEPGGKGIPKHVVRAPKVDKLFALDDSLGRWMDDVGDDGGSPLEFQMALDDEQKGILKEGGVNAMHVRATAPHPHYVPWRIAHVEHAVEAVATTWAQLYLKSNAYKNLKKAEGDVSPFTGIVEREKVALLLVGVDLSSAGGKGGKGGGGASNVRFVCEKCYDSYIAATTEKSIDGVNASLIT